MITTNMHEAKTRLSELVLAAESGEEVVICRRGRPSVRLVAIVASLVPRDLTPDPSMRVTLASGFDAAEPLSEEEWPEEYR